MRKWIGVLMGLLLALPACAEKLDLSQFEGGEPPAAEVWEQAPMPHWYQRPDGSDARVLPDGSVIVTLSATGDVTIGGDTRKKGKTVFDKQLAKQPSGLAFPLENVKSIFEEDDLTLVNFEGTLTNSTYVPSNKRENQFLFSAPPEYSSIFVSSSLTDRLVCRPPSYSASIHVFRSSTSLSCLPTACDAGRS